jgi:hypothetical protein
MWHDMSEWMQWMNAINEWMNEWMNASMIELNETLEVKRHQIKLNDIEVKLRNWLNWHEIEWSGMKLNKLYDNGI